MAMSKKSTQTVAEYLASFPLPVRQLLRQIRMTIRKAAPKAEERMAYGVPTYFLQGNLVHFGAFKSHIGFYPGPAAIKLFHKELAGYKGAKGSVQFPFAEPLPLTLISRIVKHRVKQNLKKDQKA